MTWISAQIDPPSLDEARPKADTNLIEAIACSESSQHPSTGFLLHPAAYMLIVRRLGYVLTAIAVSLLETDENGSGDITYMRMQPDALPELAALNSRLLGARIWNVVPPRMLS